MAWFFDAQTAGLDGLDLTANRRMTKGGFASLGRFKIDSIPSVDIRHSLFDIRFFKVSISIKRVSFIASGWADTRHRKPTLAQNLNTRSEFNPCIIRFSGSRQSIFQGVDTVLREKRQQF